MIWARSASRTMVLGAAAALFGVVCVLPVASMLGVVVTDSGADAVRVLQLDARQRGLLASTLLVASGTALLTTLIGVPLGVMLARVPLTGASLVRIALAAPFALPPYVVALAWVYLAGSGGLIGGATGTILVLSLVFYPLPMLGTEVALRGIDARLEEAGLLVGTPWRVLRSITLPLAGPVILAAALVVFVLAASDFGVPSLMQVRVYPTEVFTAFSALYDFGRATLMTLPLLLLSALAAGAAGSLLGERLRPGRRGNGGPATSVGQWHGAFVAAAATIIVVALLLPLGVLIREAMGVQSFAETLSASRGAMTNSLGLSAVTATVTVGLAFWIACWRARANTVLGRVADIVLVVLFTLPGPVVGVGLILLWNRPGLAGAVYGSSAMIVLACLARLVPVAALALAARIRLVPASHEEAAAASGAGWLRTMVRIVVPQMGAAIAAAWIVAFVLAFGELGATILVAPPGDATLPIHIYTMIANAPASQVAALALLQAVVVVAPLAVLGIAVTARDRR